jgi:hypothetical protein
MRLKAAPTNYFKLWQRLSAAIITIPHLPLHHIVLAEKDYSSVLPLLAASKSRFGVTKTGPPSSEICPVLYIVS